MAIASPARIMEVGRGFWPAKVLRSAIELRVFTVLGATAMTGGELQGALRLHPRASRERRGGLRIGSGGQQVFVTLIGVGAVKSADLLSLVI